MAAIVAYAFLTDRFRLAVDFAVYRPDSFWQVFTTPPALAVAPLVLLPMALR
jgi:hypothetical protein